MAEREVAWRIFAAEFNDSSVIVGGTEERSPSYLISPLGAKMNRVFTVGVITDIENLGTPGEPLWRARLSDPSGVFFISAGQFQPEAALAMSKLRPPAFVAVIGKVRTYSPEDGILYVSIRPEVVREVTEDVRDYWVLESARALKERLEAYGEALNMASPSVEELMELGYDRKLSEGIVKALEEYPDAPVDRYENVLHEALQRLLPENKGEEDFVPSHTDEDIEPDVPDYGEMEDEVIDVISGDVDVPEDEPEPGPELPDDAAGEEDDELSENEEKILELVEKLDDEGSGVEWSDLEAGAKKAKIGKQDFEEAVMGLLDKGLVYEPILGKIRKI